MFFDWLRKILKVEEKHIFEVRKIDFKMPADDECVLFSFPKGTPKGVMNEFDQRLIEFQNQQRNFVTTDLQVTVYKNKKQNMEVDTHEGESDPVKGSGTTKK